MAEHKLIDNEILKIGMRSFLIRESILKFNGYKPNQSFSDYVYLFKRHNNYYNQ